MPEEFSRTELIFGAGGMERLYSARAAVFGIGGVGGHALEALVRSGIGAVDIIDADRVSVSNINRQIIALRTTVGMYKTDAAEARILGINPLCRVRKYNIFYSAETAGQFDLSEYDYIIDAIDTVSSKTELIANAVKCGAPIISSMGTGNKLDPTMLEVSDIYKTSVCPLARVMRHELRKRGVLSLKVVYSKEQPFDALAEGEETHGRHIPGSNSFVPAAAGLILAGEAIKDIAFGAAR